MIGVRLEFEKCDDEFLKFDLVENKFSQRPDIHAFLLLDKLCPGNSDMVSAADHDIIYLGVGIEELSAVATARDIIELRRCGVMYDEDNECLTMFV